MKHHYTREDIQNALRCIGLKKGDVVFSHSNVGFLGVPAGGSDIKMVRDTFLEAMFDVIGDEGTFIVPTFTYSFSQGKPFNPDETVSDCGMLAEAVRQHALAIRSEDPCVSIAAIGARAKEMTEYSPENAYGPGSFFESFHKAAGVVCNINFDAGSTFVHYIERLLNVPYRFDKTFTGVFQKQGREEVRRSTLWVRHLSGGTSANFEAFDQIARDMDLYKVEAVGRGFIGAIRVKDIFNIIKGTLPVRPLFLTEANKNIEEEAEKRRV